MIEINLMIERQKPFNDSTPLFDKLSDHCLNTKHITNSIYILNFSIILLNLLSLSVLFDIQCNIILSAMIYVCCSKFFHLLYITLTTDKEDMAPHEEKKLSFCCVTSREKMIKSLGERLAYLLAIQYLVLSSPIKWNVQTFMYLKVP